jgi:hypothetical protein
MSPNIPIPTDSVHKFYAGFGLVVFIASLITAVYIQNSTNDKMFELFEASAKIEKMEDITDADRQLLNRIVGLIDVVKSDKKTFLTVLVLGAFFGLFVAGWGFQIWEKKIQPLLDDKLKLEVQLLELEIELKRVSLKQQQSSRFVHRHIKRSMRTK